MGVALQDAPVHEGPGVAFIGIADDVLDVSRGIPAEFPFEPGGKAGAAPAPQARGLDLGDHLLRGHLGDRLAEGLIASPGDVFFDALGIDEAAIPQGDLHLFAEEGQIFIFGELRRQFRGVRVGIGPDHALHQKIFLVDAAQGLVLINPPFFQGFHQGGGRLRGHGLVGQAHLLGIDHVHQGLPLAKADAAGLRQDHVQAQFRDLLGQGRIDLVRPGGDAAGGHPHHDLDLVGIGQGQTLLLDFFQLLQIGDFHNALAPFRCRNR